MSQCHLLENNFAWSAMYTDGPIIEGEEEQKSMATLLKRAQITRYAPDFSDMLFMLIVMASPRGYSDFILEAEKYAKNFPKMVVFVHLVQCCLKFSNKNLAIASATPNLFHRVTIQNLWRACRSWLVTIKWVAIDFVPPHLKLWALL